MKSKEKILRYLSGLMTDVEKKSFLNEFENSVELRNQFEKINGKLNELNIKSDQLLDETYFINLLPKVRTKINERNKEKKSFKTAISFAVLSSLIIFSYIFFNPSANNNMFISSFEIENILYSNSTLDVSLAKDLLKDQLNNDYYTRDLFVQAYSAYNFTKQDLSFAAAHIEFDNTDLFDIFENMSDDDYNAIYKTISSTNILR